MEKTAKTFSKARKGQGLVEYIILIGLIALVVFGIIKTFGSDLEGQFTKANSQVSTISGNFNTGSSGSK